MLHILELLWLISSAFAGASAVTLFGVVVSRAVTNHLERIEHAKRGAVTSLLCAARVADGNRAPAADRRMVRVAAELIRDAAGSAEKERIVASAERLGVAQRLRADLRSWFASTRSTAAALLVAFPEDTTVAALVGAIKDRDSDVRLTAALSLARMRRAPPTRTLVDTLGLGTIETSRLTTALFEEIAAAHPEQIVELITRKGLPTTVERAAIEALSDAPQSGIVEVLIGLASDRDVKDADLAFYLERLGDFHDLSAVTVVAKGLDHPSAQVRSAAALAAGNLGLESAAPRLAQLLSDADWWVRFHAAEALVGMGAAGREKLLALTASESTVAGQTAAITLAEHGLAR